MDDEDLINIASLLIEEIWSSSGWLGYWYAPNCTDLTPHSLRHTHTSLLAEAGVALEQIMERLGHSGNQITKNIYLHIMKEMKKEAPTSLLNSWEDPIIE